MYLPSRINASTFVTSTLRPALTPSLLLKTQIVLPASTIALMIFVCIYVTGSQAAPARSQDQTTPAPVVAREDIPQALAAAIQEARLQAGDAAADDHFGLSVALSSDGNTALVGALDDDNSGGANAGSAYVFTRSGTTWTQQTRLQASDPSAEDHFGISVALSADGNTALVGADSDDNVGVDAGSAYVFTRSGAIWTEQSRLQAGDAAEDDNFGNAVALSSDGSTALVGALFDDHSGRNFAGSAYVFTRSGTTWAEQARLQASNHTNGAIFGVAVALSADGNTALVGAFFGDSSSGVGTGSAYVFIRSGATWAEQARLESSDAANADRFGEAVVLSADGNTALIGAPFDDNSGGTNAGSAYVFTRSGTAWSQQTKLIAGGAAPGDQFGLAVALGSDDGIALIGAPSDDDSGTNAGSAYIFNRSGETWAEQGRLVSSDIAPADFFGISVALSSDGNIALFGASADDNSGGTNAGSAYTFFGLSPVEAGQLLISEFRLRGPNGANDEFVEIFNNTDAPITILAQDGSAGFALVASDGVARCTIPNGTVIPTRGHYLCVNSVGYSLASYPAGNGTT
ncbi:MAG TPA: hypothetical protein VGV59_16425, partial [Pyrinomonadaceae bacterium]|nr:hypothetical protein [Pyrinomonadaceae bacterium]